MLLYFELILTYLSFNAFELLFDVLHVILERLNSIFKELVCSLSALLLLLKLILQLFLLIFTLLLLFVELCNFLLNFSFIVFKHFRFVLEDLNLHLSFFTSSLLNGFEPLGVLIKLLFEIVLLLNIGR